MLLRLSVTAHTALSRIATRLTHLVDEPDRGSNTPENTWWTVFGITVAILAAGGISAWVLAKTNALSTFGTGT